jgi:hypothetical protein
LVCYVVYGKEVMEPIRLLAFALDYFCNRKEFEK